MFVSIFILIVLLIALLLNILLKFIVRSHKPLGLSRFIGFSLWIVVVIARRSTWEVPLVFGKVLLNLVDVYVFAVCLINYFLKSVLVQLAQIVKVGHILVGFIDLFAVPLGGILFATNWEGRIVATSPLLILILILLIETKSLSVKVVVGVLFSLFREHLPCWLLLVWSLALGLG